MLLYIILVVAIFFALFWCVMYYENRALSLTRYTISSDRLPKGASGTSFVMIADLHSNQFGHGNEKLIRKINELAPDFIIIAGDLFIGREYRFDIAYELLEQLSIKYKIYYSYGNHEQKVWMCESQQEEHEELPKLKNNRKRDTRNIKTFAEFIEKTKKLGVHIINNEEVIFSDKDKGSIHIFGGMIDLDYFKRFHRPKMTCDYLNHCFGENDKSDYQILIAHNPLYFDTYAKWGADLVLSGHVHGGMVRLPILGGVISPQMQIFPKYDAGLFQKIIDGRESNMIVSRGLGIHTLKIRVWNRPELVYVTLENKNCTNKK